MKYLTETALLIMILVVQVKLDAQIAGGKVGVVERVNSGNSEVIINLSVDGNTVKLGDILYVKIENSIVRLIVTFPMQTVAKTRVDGKNKALIKKILKGMPVYRYHADPEADNQINDDKAESRESKPGNILYEDSIRKETKTPGIEFK